MSIERVERASGAVWRVRWREGGHNRSRVLGRRADAVAFNAEVVRRKRLGELAAIDTTQTIAEFAEEWWTVHAEPNLALATRRVYAGLWDRHVLPRIGGVSLRAFTVEAAQRFAADLAAAGVGPAARRKTLALLGAVLQRAVEWGRISSNPVRVVRKPPARAARLVRPIEPSRVEGMRSALLAAGHQRDAALIGTLAYAGLRPGEALALRWRDIGVQQILVERAVADGEIKPTKTGRPRSVRLLAPLRDDLETWRHMSPFAGDDDLVFPSAAGSPWHEHDWRNWRRRTFTEAAKRVGLVGARPYDLRHSFVSLLIDEGCTIVEVAAEAGHSPTMALSTYAHVMAGSGGTRVSADSQIRQAREAHVTALVEVQRGCVRIDDVDDS